MTVVLEAEALGRDYAIRRGLFAPPQSLRAVDGASFMLARGETLAVVGESGSGKSTLARLCTLIEKPTTGRLRLTGIDPLTADKAQTRILRRTVQMVFQDPYGSLNPRQQVGSILAEPLKIAGGMTAAERTDAVAAMMAKVGLRPEHARRYPHMFSGGQRQRIAIARALMLRPAVVVADEPVSALDVSVRAQVLNLLMDLQAEFQLAYLFISHDLTVVQHIANRIMVMYLGRPVEQGTKEAIFARPAHPYTRALLAATPRATSTGHVTRQPLAGEMPSPLDPPPGCAFNSRCPFAKDRCRAERPRLRPVFGRDVACHFAEDVAG